METKHTVEQLIKGHNSGKTQLSMTSIKYDQVMGTISGKFHQNHLKTVGGGVAETRLTIEKLLKGHNSDKKSAEHDLDII